MARRLPARLWIMAPLLAWWACAPAGAAPPRIPSQLNDYYFYGTQPEQGEMGEEMVEAQQCGLCHSDFSGISPEKYTLPYNRWVSSMMAQAYRDPVFHAQMDIGERDAPQSSDSCIKCHAPAGWVQNRGPTRPAGNPEPLNDFDVFGVSCSVCHRMVNPVETVPSPLAGTEGTFTATTDREILEALGIDRPPNFPSGGPLAANSYVIDPQDRRRGPYDLGFMPYHNWLQASLQATGMMCASCHDISNSLYARQIDGSYALTPVGQPHPTGNKYDMYPMDRTFSEWLASTFSTTPVDLTYPDPNGGPTPVGRYSFDGVTRTDDDTAYVVFNSDTSYAKCQDCHQPKAEGPGCNLGVVPRDVPVHNFAGSNTWVLRAIFDLYGSDSGMFDPAQVDEAVARNASMLARAADLQVTRVGGDLLVRVVNQTGHKLPTGFSEGRRAWLTVTFYDENQVMIERRGAYDNASATLVEGDTKVYQAKHGIDETMSEYFAQRALITGDPSLAIPAGPTFHLDLNNKIYLDNRIPPRGFTNAGFAAVQAAPVAYAYADGQYWDDTLFPVPPGTRTATISLNYQTTSRAYAEFLRDKATSVSTFVPQVPPAPPIPQSIGQVVYDEWVRFGKSKPVEMAFASYDFTACNLADITGIGGPPSGPDGQLTVDDIIAFINTFSDGLNCPGLSPCNLSDVSGIGGPPEPPDGQLTVDDIIAFFNSFADGC